MAVVGSSGSGKSLLAHAVMGLLPYNGSWKGDIRYRGEALTEKRLKKLRGREIVLVPQSVSYLDPLMRAGEQVRKGKRDSESREKCRRVLGRYGLGPETEERYPFELSGGQKRRVAIAGVLAMNPKVLILDEPTAGLDPMGRDEILDQIASLHETRGITIILVSHSMEDIAKYVERIIVMNHGVKTFDDAPKKVFAHYKELEAIGLAAPQITYIMHALKEKGLDVDTSAINVDEATTSILRALWKKEEDHK